MNGETAASILVEAGALAIDVTGLFAYENGFRGPVCIDSAALFSRPAERATIADALVETLEERRGEIQLVAGTGGVSIALADHVARRLGVPMVYTRRGRKGHGTGKQIEGASVAGHQVTIITDQLTVGGDLADGIAAIEAEGGEVVAVRALVDAGLPGDRPVAETLALTDLTALLEAAWQSGVLGAEPRAIARAWAADPEGWHRRWAEGREAARGGDSRATSRALLSTGAVQINTRELFRYSKGGEGPIYTDGRLLLGHPEARAEVVSSLCRIIEREIGLEAIDVVAAVATAGIHYASAVAEELGLPMVIVDTKASAYGLRETVQGPLEEGARIVMVEDLVNSGGSLIEAADEVVLSGGDLVGCVAVMTYQLERAAAAFEEMRLPVHTATGIDALLAIGIEDGVLSPGDDEVVRAWRDGLNARWREGTASGN